MHPRISAQFRRSLQYAWLSARRAIVPLPVKRTVFVAGVQRSGTNMLMDLLERSWETQVFHESDPRAFDRYMMRESDVIHRLVRRSPAPVVVVKALHEGHKIIQLLDDFAPANAIWMFRHYADAINSNMKNWPGGRNQIEDVVRDKHSAGWRAAGMTDETHEVVRQHYRPGMNDASALGIFWYYRNQLFFDQKLDRDPRTLMMNYEALVSRGEEQTEGLAAFLGVRTNAAMRSLIHADSIRRASAPEIDPPVRALCDRMHDRLLDTFQSGSRSPTSSSAAIAATA